MLLHTCMADDDTWQGMGRRKGRNGGLGELDEAFCLLMLVLHGHVMQAAAEGKVVDMENFFSRLALDIIGKAVFNYDFDSLTHDDPVIEVRYLAHLHTYPRLLLVCTRPYVHTHVHAYEATFTFPWLCGQVLPAPWG